jgi:hypothetical protein
MTKLNENSTLKDIIEKVNEIVDFLEFEEPETESYPHQDNYDEEWIGKLCRFWDYPDQSEQTHNFGVLLSVDMNKEYPFEMDVGGVEGSYRYCRPFTDIDTEFYNPDIIVKKLRKLSALEAAGVDNWEGYDDAMEALKC